MTERVVRPSTPAVLAVAALLALTACSGSAGGNEISLTLDSSPAPEASTTSPPSAADPGSTSEETTATVDDDAADEASSNGAVPPPDWLGTRTLPTLPDGTVTPQTTPEELRDRQLITVDTLPGPADAVFAATIAPLEGEPLARSTWVVGCPVEPIDLRYLTLTFWGFDGEAHVGEMIVHREVAEDLVSVFESLFEARFPIEEMRIVTPADLDAPPTGDGNNTTAFACRPVVGGTNFSQHAFGLAIDINPFHNPYLRNDLLLPELAGAYLDRDTDRPGMIGEDGPVVAAFDAIGWGWGGRWESLKDYQHFSRNNR